MDEVAACTNSKWDDVFELPVMEFLNILCYIRDKAAVKKEADKNWIKNH